MNVYRKILAALCLLALTTQAFAQGVLLTSVTPVLTRTSTNGNTVVPITFTLNFNSNKFFAGYSEQIQISTDQTFATVDKYDGVKTLSEADMKSPFTPDWSGATDPVPASLSNTSYNTSCCNGTTVYIRARGLARSPGGQYFFTAWSNVISNQSVACGSVNWNDSAGTPASSTGWSISGTCNTIATRTGGSGDQIVKANTGHVLGSGTKSFDVTFALIGSVGTSVGVVTSGAGVANSVSNVTGCGYEKSGLVRAGGVNQFTSTTTYTAGDQVRTMEKSSKIYFQKWNGSAFVDIQGMDSTALTGGCAVSAGTYYPAFSTNSTAQASTATIDGTNWP